MGNRRALRVLIVDDEKWFRDELRERLLKLRPTYQVEVAAYSSEALEKARTAEQPFDVAAIDYVLAGRENGIDVMRQLRQVSSDTEYVMFTGWGLEESGLEAMKAGAYRYVRKPFDVEELALIIDYAKEYRELKGAAREKRALERLMETSAAVLSGRSLEEVLQAILQAVQATGFDRVRLYLRSEDGETMVGRAHVGMDADFVGRRLPIAEDPYVQALLENPRPRVFEREDGKPVPFEQELAKEEVDQWTCVPLLLHGELIGKLSADNKFSGRPIVEEELSPVALFASQAAAAIEMAQLVDKQRHDLEKLAYLYEQAAALGKGLDLKSSLEVLIDTLRETFRLDTCTVGLLNPDGTALEFVAARGIDVLPKVSVSDIPEELWRRLIEGKHVFIEDLREHPNVQRLLVHPELKEAGQFGVLPLWGRKALLGIITMGSTGELGLTEDDWRRLSVFADRANVAIENVRLFEHSEWRAEQMKHLMEVGEALAKQTDLKTALQLISDAVHDTMGYQMVAVCLCDPEDKIRLLASTGLTKDEKAKLGEAIGHWEAFSAPMQERFRISRSYFIPEEDYPWKNYRLPSIVRELGPRKPEEWHSQDLLRVPLVGTGGQVLGVISVADPSNRRRPDLDTVQTLELFANHAAAAIERAGLYKRLHNVVASAKAISEGITRSPQEVYKEIARRACEVVGADSTVIYPYEAETLRFDVDSWVGYELLEQRPPSEIKQRRGRGLAASILRKGMVIVENTSLPTERGGKPLNKKSKFIQREKVTAFVGLRLQVGERPVGILYMNFRERPHSFTEEELAAIRFFADQAALSIRIAQLYEQKRRALEGIAKAGLKIASNLELDEVLKCVVEQARAALGATSAILYPYDATKGILGMPVFEGTLKQPDLLDKPDKRGRALRRLRACNTAQFADDSSTHPIMAGEFVTREGIASSAGLPLAVADQIMGYLFVNYVQPHHFTDDEKQFFTNLANHAALAIHSARLSEELRFRAIVAGMAAWGMELAHDINREVYQIRSHADWALRYEGLPDEVQTWLQEIDQRAGALSIIPIPRQPVNQMSKQLAVTLDEALRKWVGNYAIRRPETQVQCDLQCAETQAAISDWWLGRVMRHLVRNALEAMPAGGTLTIRSRVQEDGCAEVQVEDTGIGIPADVLPDLFRLPQSSKGEGRGYGLIIARFALEQYGGKIWLERTEQGKGTTFAFILPLLEGAPG